MHHDPKPKDTDSEDEAGVERKKPEGSWFPPKREKGSNTSDVSSTIIFSIVKSFFFVCLKPMPCLLKSLESNNCIGKKFHMTLSVTLNGVET